MIRIVRRDTIRRHHNTGIGSVVSKSSETLRNSPPFSSQNRFFHRRTLHELDFSNLWAW